MSRFADRRRVGFNPFFGSVDSPQAPSTRLLRPRRRNISLLVGTTEHEMTVFSARDSWLAELDDGEPRRRLTPFISVRVMRWSMAHRLLYPKATAGKFIQDHHRPSRHNAAVLCYHRSQDGSEWSAGLRLSFPRRGACAERPSAGWPYSRSSLCLQTVADAPFLADSPEDRQRGDTISAAWAQFARTGRPAADGMPEWPSYSGDKRATMLLDLECRVEADPFRGVREVWGMQAASNVSERTARS